MSLHLNGNIVMLGARKVGYLSRDSEDAEKVWFVSPRKRGTRVKPEHFHWNLNGWGVAVETVEFLEDHDVYGIKLVVDQKELLMSSLEMIRKHGVAVKYGDFEPQLIMSEKHWLKNGQVML